MNWPVTDEMIKAAVDAWPHLDDSTDRTLWGAVYRTMRDADPFASAERAVIELALQVATIPADWEPLWCRFVDAVDRVNDLRARSEP